MDKMKMQTSNIVDENVEFIESRFPNCIVEARDEDGNLKKMVDFDILKQELSQVVVDGDKERYQMTWPDKRKAILTANAPINATLRPCREESVDFDNTKNLYIEGDNLDVLKLLRETYLGKVKMIYIDPPYNTGNDFVYNDDFAESTEEYVANSGQFDDQGNRLVQNTESNGRFHTDWLNMIYPRLKVAKDLLSDDGVIFISIGEHEVDNLKKICLEIFGESNFIENYVWESTFRPDNSSKIMRRNAEYVMCISKNSHSIEQFIGEIKEKEGLPSLTKSSMKESILLFPANTVITYLQNGVYKAGVRDSYELLDDVIVKDGIIVNEFRLKGHMIWGQSNLNKELQMGTEIIIKGDGFVPYTKKIGDSIMSPTKIIPNHLVGDILSSNAEMAKLFDTKVFSYPKPVSLIKYLLNYIPQNDCIIMDFFSGSSTTAQAIMELNIKDSGCRQFIMIQLPENLDDMLLKTTNESAKAIIKNAIALCDGLGKPHFLPEVAKERIRRAGKLIKEETGKCIDYGFRVFKLDSSNMKDTYYSPSEYDMSLLDTLDENIKPDRTPEDLLFQVMLDLGLMLDSKIESKQINGKKVFIVGEYNEVVHPDLVCCFDSDVSNDTVTEIAKMKPKYAVFRDSSMSSDSVAVNFDQLFETYSPSTTRKVL